MDILRSTVCAKRFARCVAAETSAYKTFRLKVTCCIPELKTLATVSVFSIDTRVEERHVQ